MGYYNFKAEGSAGPAAYYLGTLASGSTMNIASRYPDYANLTSANFIIVPQSGSVSNQKTAELQVPWDSPWVEWHYDTNSATFTAPSVSYNPTNGNLSFTCTVACGGNAYCFNSAYVSSHILSTSPSATQGITAKVYLVPKIENL
jgi:hypothetical protein